VTLVGKLSSFLLLCWLVPSPAYAAAAEPAAKSSVRAKAIPNAKAKAKVKAKTKSKITANTTQPSRAGSPVISPRQAPVDENSLNTDIAAARRILVRKPNDVEAQARLARAAVVLIDWLLSAEAVGDSGKVQRLAQKLDTDLHGTGRRVQKMSQQGDVMAKQAAGFIYAQGILLKPNPEKSCAEFIAAAEKLAAAGWHAAQCLMASSPDKAWMQMERAAQRGHAAAQEWMGRRCLGEFGAKEKNFVCARDYLIPSASQGRPSAQTLLAYLMVTGQGGSVDLSRAIRLYTSAAEKGDARAQNNLGELYETGRGVPMNLEDAIRWYERAVENGLGSAQFNAGRLWAIGIGGKKDPAKARAFLAQAEANGVPQARQMLDWLDRPDLPKRDDMPVSKPAAPAPLDDAKAKD
jgi:TPR repeat protein